jgi:ribonuclease P protein component
MLPAKHRLRRRSDVANVLSNGRKTPAGAVVIHSLPINNPPSEFAFVVSKKVGNSVVRHRVTRVLRHIVAEHASKFNPPQQVVVRALSKAPITPTNVMNSDFVAAIEKVNANAN